MKKIISKTFVSLSLILLIVSCSSSSLDEFSEQQEETIQTTFIESKAIELEILALINEYRLANGFSKLEQLNIIKTQTEKHTDYMIKQQEISHENFNERASYLIDNTKAITVGENVAFGFTKPEKLVQAWIDSPAHKENIEGEYNYFDLTAKLSDKGRWYFTNIFVKK